MELPIVHVDAFADGPFTGNPAAVMRLPRWLDDATLGAIAAQNNLSETAFVVRQPGGWRLRWFTPTVEVELCGHATLAAGYVLLAEDGGEEVRFQTRSGELAVRAEADGHALALPTHPAHAAEAPSALIEALGAAPRRVMGIKALHRATYWLADYDDEAQIRALRPDTRRLGAELKANVVCTAPGRDVDFVSRFFAPASGVDEDPVTGSAHATLTPLWADRLGKPTLTARQLSRRGGALTCTLDGDRVWLRGRCRPYLRGFVTL